MKISDERLIEIYGESKESRKRYEQLGQRFMEKFAERNFEFFSAPGRMELIGNHTDHNGGAVIAGSISMDTIAAAAPNGRNIIEIISEGYKHKIVVDINNLKKITDGTTGLVAGMVEAIKRWNYKIEGFSAYISSNVIAAAGVSSSASFEMLFCSIVNYYFNEERITYLEYAKIGQYAENHYWGKASGLMDQLACAVGGVIQLDFKSEVLYQKLDFDLKKFDYKFVLVNSEKSHANMSNEYSAIPNEMYSVAAFLGVKKLGESSLDAMLQNYKVLRRTLRNDRALMRAFHFFEENNRVESMKKAMNENDTPKILRLIEQSGLSSWRYLQNCFVQGNEKEQNLALNLALSEMINQKNQGVCRVHGGGFSGVILEVISSKKEQEYITFMSQMVGDDNVYPLNIREVGAIHV